MDLAQLFQWLLELPDAWLYASLFAAALVENVLPPVPGDTVVVFGGYLAGLGRLSLPVAYAMVTFGSWCGFMTYYLLGRWLGRSGVHDLLGRWIPPATLARGEEWVRRHGHWAVLANRLLAGARSVISLAAGFVRMPAGLVGALALASSMLWNVLLVGGGYWIGEEWQRVIALLRAYEQAVLFAVACVAVILLVRYWRRRSRARMGTRP
ncbi:MAG TPA: DedA family protein [bacterium]|jgi:membrane protein DedA with SNARE-associated domain